MRKSTKQELNRIESKINDIGSQLGSFRRQTNLTVEELHRKFYQVGFGPESSATRGEVIRLSRIFEAKIDALESSFNEVLEVLELETIKKTSCYCPECKQPLPKADNGS
jgi:hypothetical protein